ncbi:hypothetical protein BSKO_03435 [Bryopsis sp. KO-2023]|nr:hypothetical protein BSKO_03435 [Bryopsis sp. KO-2023]
MAAVSDDALIERLRGLLSEIDMEKTSEKMVRKMLEKEFEIDLSDKKSLIRDQITKCLAEIQDNDDDDDVGEEGDDDFEHDEQEEEEEEPPPPKQKVGKKRKQSGPPPVLSDEMQAFLGCESMPRTEIIKQLWLYIKEQDLQDPANKRNIRLDDKLSTLFTPPLTMFSMPKQLSAHIRPASKQAKKVEPNEPEGNDVDLKDEEGDCKKEEQEEEKVGAMEEEAEEKPTRRTRAKPKAAGSKGEGKKRGGGGFTKPIKVTTELAEFLGTEEITRPNLTKFMWNYFKSNELQDPADRRHILCDEKLKALTNVDRFQAFSFMKFLKHHVVS